MANDGDLFLEHTGDAQVRRLASTGSVVDPNIHIELGSVSRILAPFGSGSRFLSIKKFKNSY